MESVRGFVLRGTHNVLQGRTACAVHRRVKSLRRGQGAWVRHRLQAVAAGIHAPGKLLRAFYYTALLENDDYSPIRPLVDWLHYNGFTMVTKPAKEYTDSQGRRKVKGNMDIELTVDAMELAPRVDHIVLFSGDGDFRPLVESLQRQGVRVSVVSTIRSQPPMIADELRRQADNFIELDELRDVIGRPPREPRPGEREEVSVDVK
jgi:uncharacterized LabA/DUF88 family protein